MSGVSEGDVRAVVAAVLADLESRQDTGGDRGTAAAAQRVPAAQTTAPTPTAPRPPAPREGAGPQGEIRIDVPEPTTPEERRAVGVASPANPSGLANLIASTGARIGVGRAGPRPRTRTRLLFLADHAVTQDAIFGEVPAELLGEFGLFTVQSQVNGPDEYLLRPDLGRLLSNDARAEVERRCVKQPQVQIVVGDGLSAAAVTHNLPKIYPVLVEGLGAAGVTVGTPFFVRYCRVGIMNDVNAVVGADVVVLLIGERPGLGVADALSVYSGWQPGPGKTDAQRDVICMITANGGTNPLEAGAFVVEHVRSVLAHRASGVELRLQQAGER